MVPKAQKGALTPLSSLLLVALAASMATTKSSWFPIAATTMMAHAQETVDSSNQDDIRSECLREARSQCRQYATCAYGLSEKERMDGKDRMKGCSVVALASTSSFSGGASADMVQGDSKEPPAGKSGSSKKPKSTKAGIDGHEIRHVRDRRRRMIMTKASKKGRDDEVGASGQRGCLRGFGIDFIDSIVGICLAYGYTLPYCHRMCYTSISIFGEAELYGTSGYACMESDECNAGLFCASECFAGIGCVAEDAEDESGYCQSCLLCEMQSDVFDELECSAVCTQDDVAISTRRTVAGYLSMERDYEALAGLIELGVVGAEELMGGITLLAPDDGAVERALKDRLYKDTLEKFFDDQDMWFYHIRDILLYHVLPMEYSMPMLQEAVGTRIVSANGEAVDVGEDKGKITINGEKIEMIDVAFNGAVAYTIESLIVPPSAMMNLVELITAANLTGLLPLLDYVSAEVLNVASGPGPLTFFAPSNEAVGALLETDENLLSEDNAALINSIVSMHFAPGNYHSDDLSMGMQEIASLNSGEMLSVRKTQRMVTVNDATVVQPNLIATNGIMHVIDQVLLPA